MAKSGMDITVDLSKMRDVIKKHPQRADDWLTGVANQMLGDIVLSFGTSPPGRAYTRGGVTHIASMPGFPPNVDTGALRSSLKVRNAGPFHRVIEDGVEYGVILELVKNRPFMVPVFEAWRTKILDDAKKNLTVI